MRDNDFKYVMMDVGNIYLGARFSFGELLSEEQVPFKLKAVINHYILKEAALENTLESQFYYLEKGTFLYDVFSQLKTRVKINIRKERRTLLTRREKQQYQEKIVSLRELAEMELPEKKASGVIVREIVISKLGLMSFSV